MISYVEYLNIPAKIAITLIVLFFCMQIVGEILEFKGKVVPEFIKIRKVFARRKHERMVFNDVSSTLKDVKKSLDEMNAHYSIDNIRMRDDWIKRVNDKLDQYDTNILELGEKLDKNNKDTLSILIENRRSSIIGFASVVIDDNRPVTREQFNRIFKLYQEYEDIIAKNEMTNGEVDIAIRIIKESYENHMRNHTFVEDLRGY